jgi:hypothetical protein
LGPIPNPQSPIPKMTVTQSKYNIKLISKINDDLK